LAGEWGETDEQKKIRHLARKNGNTKRTPRGIQATPPHSRSLTLGQAEGKARELFSASTTAVRSPSNDRKGLLGKEEKTGCKDARNSSARTRPENSYPLSANCRKDCEAGERGGPERHRITVER